MQTNSQELVRARRETQVVASVARRAQRIGVLISPWQAPWLPHLSCRWGKPACPFSWAKTTESQHHYSYLPHVQPRDMKLEASSLFGVPTVLPWCGWPDRHRWPLVDQHWFQSFTGVWIKTASTRLWFQLWLVIGHQSDMNLYAFHLYCLIKQGKVYCVPMPAS